MLKSCLKSPFLKIYPCFFAGTPQTLIIGLDKRDILDFRANYGFSKLIWGELCIFCPSSTAGTSLFGHFTRAAPVPRPSMDLQPRADWPSGDTNHWPPRRLLHSIRLLWFIWVWINTYRYIFSGMNIHLPAILGFTGYQGFDPSPFILIYYVCNATYFPVLYCHVMYRKVNIVNVYKSKNAQILGGHFSDSPALPGSAWQAQTIVIHAGRWAQRLENESWAGLRLQWTSVKCYGENIPLAIFWSFDVVWLNQKHWTDQSIPEDLQNR